MNRLIAASRQHAFVVMSLMIAFLLMLVVVNRVAAAPGPPSNFTEPVVATAEPSESPSTQSPGPEATDNQTPSVTKPTYVPVKPKARDIDDDDDDDDDDKDDDDDDDD